MGEKRTALTVEMEALTKPVEALFHQIEKVAETVKSANAEAFGESIGVVSELMTLKEIGSSVREAIVAARAGDWDEYTRKMGEASTVAASAATGGVLGAVQAVGDSIAAIHMAHGGDDYSWSTLLTGVLNMSSSGWADLAFHLTNPDDVADVRVNPYGPDNSFDNSNHEAHSVGLEKIDRSDIGGQGDTDPVVQLPPGVIYIFDEPSVITVTPPNTLGPPVDVDDSGYGSAVAGLPDPHSTDDASIPVGDLDIPIYRGELGAPADTGPDLGALKTFDDSAPFDGSFATLRNGGDGAPEFDPGAFGAIVPDHGSVPELSGWCGTASFDVAPSAGDMGSGLDASVPGDGGIGGSFDGGATMPDLGAQPDPGGGFGGFDFAGDGGNFGGADMGGIVDTGGPVDTGGYVPADTGGMP